MRGYVQIVVSAEGYSGSPEQAARRAAADLARVGLRLCEQSQYGEAISTLQTATILAEAALALAQSTGSSPVAPELRGE